MRRQDEVIQSPDLPAMLAVCGAFLAQDYVGQPTSFIVLGRRAKRILMDREVGLAAEAAGQRVKDALVALYRADAFVLPEAVHLDTRLNGVTFPVALRRALGLTEHDAPPAPVDRGDATPSEL